MPHLFVLILDPWRWSGSPLCQCLSLYLSHLVSTWRAALRYNRYSYESERERERERVGERARERAKTERDKNVLAERQARCRESHKMHLLLIAASREQKKDLGHEKCICSLVFFYFFLFFLAKASS